VFRAGRGMLLTTEARPGAQGHVKDMGETIERLSAAQRLHDALTQGAQQCGAQDADSHQADIVKTLDAQNQQIRGDGATQDNPFPELSEPHLMLAGKAGVEIVTPATVHVAAQQVAVTTEGDLGIASGRSLFASVFGTIRMVAQREVMKFVAAMGDIVLHAVTRSIMLIAKDKIEISGDEIVLRAGTSLRIEAGGSFAQFDSSGIVHGTKGKFVAHAAVHGLPGPRDIPLDVAPKKICVECLLKAAKGGVALVPR
jgi:type VI secretion system secreted protein VgrG